MSSPPASGRCLVVDLCDVFICCWKLHGLLLESLGGLSDHLPKDQLPAEIISFRDSSTLHVYILYYVILYYIILHYIILYDII